MNDKSQIVWHPSVEIIEQSALWRFMCQENISSYEDLLTRSTNLDWFWNAFIAFANIEFYTPYSKIVDLSDGLPLPKWFVGGQINIAHNALDKWAIHTEYQDNIALVWEGETGTVERYSYKSLYEKANQAAHGLRSLGVQRGDRVAIYMPLIPETVIAVFAIYKLGAVVVPLFSGFGQEAISFRLNDVSAKVVITAGGFCRNGKWQPMKATLDAALIHVQTVEHVVTVNSARESLLNNSQDHDWNELLGKQSVDFATVHTYSEEICMISYSSGTSGKPKGVVQVHGGVAVKSAEFGIFNYDMHQGDIIHQITDFGWMMGQAPMLRAYSAGATLLLYEGSPTFPSPNRMFELIEKHHISVFGAPATALRIMKTQVPNAPHEHNLTSLRMLTHTSEPIDTDTWMWYFSWTDGRVPIINVSGGTELFAEIICSSFMQPLKPTCLGITPGINPIIVDENGTRVHTDNSGYLCFTLPQPAQTRGFWNESSERYLQTYFPYGIDYWWHGDIVQRDDDGFWFHKGRADDVIKVAGRRTGPGEIEDAISQLQGVQETAVIGIPHSIKGEEIVVFVVAKPDTHLSPELISSHIIQSLGKPYEPGHVYLVQDLPKTRTGKIMRRLIKQHYLGTSTTDRSSLSNPDALDALPRYMHYGSR